MEINNLMKKIEKLFLECGFKEEIIGQKQYLVFNNCYCKITYLEKLGAFVIESADNIKDALNEILEDGDLYYMDVSEEDMLSQVKRDILRYYVI